MSSNISPAFLNFYPAIAVVSRRNYMGVGMNLGKFGKQGLVMTVFMHWLKKKVVFPSRQKKHYVVT